MVNLLISYIVSLGSWCSRSAPEGFLGSSWGLIGGKLLESFWGTCLGSFLGNALGKLLGVCSGEALWGSESTLSYFWLKDKFYMLLVPLCFILVEVYF